MARLRFKVQKVVSGYVDVEISSDEMACVLSDPDKSSSEVIRKAREDVLGDAINFDKKVVWGTREKPKREVFECPVLIYDFTDPVVLGEAIEDAGDGKAFLTYKIHVMESGEPSIVYGFYDPEKETVTYQRVPALDPSCVLYKGDERWCVIEEDLAKSREFEKLTREIAKRGKDYSDDRKSYLPLYPAWGNTYDPEAVYTNEEYRLFTSVFPVIRMGNTIWYGRPVANKFSRWRYFKGFIEAGKILFKVNLSLLTPEDDSMTISNSLKPVIGNPKVVSEEIAHSGGGVNYLIYEIAVKEDGMDSILYALFDPDNYEFAFQRASFFDPYETEGNEEWCDVPNGLDKDPQLFGILSELKKSTKMMGLGLYKRRYPERVYKYSPHDTFFDPGTQKVYAQVFPVKKKGETILYGYPVDSKTHEVDCEHVVRIGAGPLIKEHDGEGKEKV